MKYSNETLAKVKARIDSVVNDVIAAGVEKLHPRLIKGNIKIGEIWHFSTAAIRTCPNCEECEKFCYELKAYLMYGSVLLSRVRNYVISHFDRERCFAEIDKQLKRKKTAYKWFRWHVGGEIQDRNYFEHMVDIARNNPEWHFYTYTKNYGVVNGWLFQGNKLPENLVVMFSEWDGMPMVNPFHLPTFRCILADGSSKPLQSDEWLCPGKCKVCVELGRGCVVGEKTAAHEH